ncbi:MAG TPA: nucleotide sugar dehydrogenase [Vicinamibacterales bacterium]|nr:nucleotide sugar dehydrogenase [Vicinamibacterales bacterium]
MDVETAPLPDSAAALLDRLERRTATVAVLGLGYVGLPLAVEFASAGFSTCGLDVDSERIRTLSRGESYIGDVPTARLQALVSSGRLRPSDDSAVIAEADAVCICVPTPLRKTKDPDLSYVIGAVEQVGAHLRRGQLVVLESTTYPGTTEEVVLPRLQGTGLVPGRDFFLAFSPERVDPGNGQWHTGNIPKVVGGVDPVSTRLAAALYGHIVERVVPVSSSRVAEMVKLLENTFRAVNIGLVNELALMCHDLGLDVWEVIDAAATKPFGFMPFYPGPGVGGHCIPIDSFYLSWKARQTGFESRFIELAGHINSHMPRYVVQRAADALNSVSKAIRGSRIHLFGMAYKANVGDARESPAIDVAVLLQQRGAVISYSDPYVPAVSEHGLDLRATPQDEALAAPPDLAIITTNHAAFDYPAIVARSPLVLDTRNALRGIAAPHVYRL